ncbi:hypothetical protein MUGA111182_05490 [Mucilaginibacter galii]|uniref:Uncharacterized protein n=1 Tax=Mucilaginibacter galii TaxID=2005073 RepID=A0A917J674_9SPHI|nr:hypothetical protein [Mucilaginibacter galii]GGI49915.1 hypothetical protein GCM10011425_11270 [Mucilaginibacter galii]
MSSEEVLKQEGLFVENTTIAGISCAVGYTKEFRWSWLATQLNTFVFIGSANSAVDKVLIERFSHECYEYATKNNRGWPRGIQSGVGSVAILKATTTDRDAAEFCEKPSKKHWSAFEIPVIYDTANLRTVKYLKNPIWGTIYFPYFTELIGKITNKL